MGLNNNSQPDTFQEHKASSVGLTLGTWELCQSKCQLKELFTKGKVVKHLIQKAVLLSQINKMRTWMVVQL